MIMTLSGVEPGQTVHVLYRSGRTFVYDGRTVKMAGPTEGTRDNPDVNQYYVWHGRDKVVMHGSTPVEITRRPDAEISI